MTCIVGLIDNKNKCVVIGADSAGSSGNSIAIRKDVKIFKNGNFIIGCTTSFRMIQLLRFSFKPPALKRKDIYEYMCTDFIDAVRSCFVHGGFMQLDKEGAEMGGNFLVAYKNRLFEVQSDYQIAENITPYNAVGCGEDVALGALYALSTTKLSAEAKVIKALEAASTMCLGVSAPFILLNT